MRTATRGSSPTDPGVIQARLAAEKAAEDVRQATVVASLDGTVTRLEATLGNHLGAGQPVATVETLDDILAGVQIDEVDIGKIRLGQEVVLTTETLRDVELLGAITLVPPSMEADRERAAGHRSTWTSTKAACRKGRGCWPERPAARASTPS